MPQIRGVFPLQRLFLPSYRAPEARFSNFLDLRNRPEATGGHGLRVFASSLRVFNPLIEIYPQTPFQPSHPQGFSDYTLPPPRWGTVTRA